jgi:3-(3-hydroxy-phenyl)propionate hydroxylase
MQNDAAYDVAIVGFGPCGAVAAALLGQAGLRVLVVDKSHPIYDKPRAVAMDHEIMRVLQGIGVADAVLPHTEPFSASEHFGADGQLIRRLTMLPPPYPMGWTPSMVFRQPPVEQILRDRVAALPSVDVQLGAELIALAQDADGVSLHWQQVDGPPGSARAAYVMGCDGASSTVRRLVGIELEDLDFDEPWLVVDVLANEQGLAKLPRASAQFCEPARPISFIIGTGNHRRWEIMLLPGEDAQVMTQTAEVWRLLARWLTPDDGVLWRSASYRFHALVAGRWRDGRVFIAGDAAHQQPPFLGQGMCQGVRDVANLAWKLQQVLAGKAGSALLDTYGQERSAHVRQLTNTIKGIGRYICERDPTAARARDAGLIAQAGGIVKPQPRQDLIPGLQAGLLSDLAHPLHPAVGTLFPQPRVLHNGQPVLLDDTCASGSKAGTDAGTGAGWRVVLGDGAQGWAVSLEDGFALLRVTSTPQAGVWTETEGVLAAWFQRHACTAAIVRPDHYVYAVATTANALQAELAALARRFPANSPELA